jgi:hypothetical protein
MKYKSKSLNQRGIQPKSVRLTSPQSRTVGPTVYRPQPLPKVLQTKTTVPRQNPHKVSDNVARTPIAPPVYRPETKKIVQPKVAGVTSLRPQAPPVYRPQPMPKVLQTKQSPDRMGTVQKHATTVKGRLLLPHEMPRVVQRKESSAPDILKVSGNSMNTVGLAPRPAITPVSSRHPVIFGVVQRAAAPKPKPPAPKAKPKGKPRGKGAKHKAKAAKPDAEAKEVPLVWKLKEIEGVTDFAKLEDRESAAQQAERIQKETVPLSKFHGVQCNCFCWALGENDFYYPGDTLSTWQHRLDEYTFVDADADDATIILWGVPKRNAEAKIIDYEVRHASVLLTHEQLRARKEGDFPDIAVTEATYLRIPDPFWSSAMGAGFGIMFHAKDFFENGVFGQAIAGMR